MTVVLVSSLHQLYKTVQAVQPESTLAMGHNHVRFALAENSSQLQQQSTAWYVQIGTPHLMLGQCINQHAVLALLERGMFLSELKVVQDFVVSVLCVPRHLNQGHVLGNI